MKKEEKERQVGGWVGGWVGGFSYLEAWELSAFAGLGALGHFDLDLVAVGEVVGGDAKPSGSNLFLV